MKGSVKEIPAGETTTADAAATASTAEETVVEEEESNKGGIPWIPIAIGGVALAGIGAAAAVFLLRNKKQQPEKKAAAEPAMVFSTCSELRVVEERRDGSRTYYRFDLNGRQTARLADLQNRKDGRRLEMIRGTNLEDVYVQAYGKELTFYRQAGGREENMFVLGQTRSSAAIETGDGSVLRFMWIPGIKEDP